MMNLISAVPTQSIAYDVHFGAFMVAGFIAVAAAGIMLEMVRQMATRPRAVAPTLRPVASH